MKKYLFFPLIILSVFMALTGCSKDDDDNTPEPPAVVKGLTPLASAASWFDDATTQQAQGYDPQVMVVIFSLENLPVASTADDVTAAFVGDQCRYAVKVHRRNGKPYGTVVMYRVNTDGTTHLSFNIRYYSDKEKGYFTSTPIAFVTNGTIGSLGKPALLTWMIE